MFYIIGLLLVMFQDVLVHYGCEDVSNT